MLSLILAAAIAAAPPPDARPVYHYERTNSDGTMGEDVVVFVEGEGRLSVMKARDRCTPAAYVTGRLDPDTGAPIELVGGRLTPQAEQAPFLWLRPVEGGGRIAIHEGTADAPPSAAVAVDSPWHIYDFDFADLIAHPLAEIAKRAPFSFDLPLILMADGKPTLSNRGRLELSRPVEVVRAGRRALRYRAAGPAFGDAKGYMWFDARSGVLVEAKLPLPNHSEYRDFHLTLVRTTRGAASWHARLAEHWQGCPTATE
ncbi:hypothetical protein K5P26_10235 [Sphingopyxis sp. XHP0097]|uniref:Uncharacterized protein n=1 Tax=Sphingopyxis jiangsuensis TaxID=2871171 RepID=A0ABS7MEX1_9SPHN|nr:MULTISPECIES: hypothetical protein [Sphingopyxis]MBY4637513.1 hypothetical protein [Sphingopyxis jiangsuensis]